MNQPTIDELKDSLDIVSIAELYGELSKNGSNYRFKNNKSIVINPAKQIFSDFNGTITGGSVLDLICYMEDLSLHKGIERLKELSGADTYTIDPAKQIKRKADADRKKNVDFRLLGLFGKNDLKAGQQYIPYIVDMGNNDKYLKIHEPFKKLFELNSLNLEQEKKITYIFNKLLGYDTYYNCPSIIIRDVTGKIVDKAAYRPSRPEKITLSDWSNPKYIHKNTNNRGNNFLYVFQREMETLMKNNKFFVVGEGIKNSLNAYLHGTTFISLESTSTEISTALIQYILKLLKLGYKIIAFFDGDKAGEQAFNNFKNTTGLHGLKNAVTFNSGIDYTSYITKGES